MPVIYIDADACPVKEDTFRVAKRYALEVYVVSRVAIHLPRADWIHPVVAGTAFDAVDDWIAEHVKANDIVVTNDVPLAARCIAKSGRVIDPRGRILDEDNIGDAVATRELMTELRQMGALDTGPKKMGKSHRSNYLAKLDELIHRAIRAGK